MLGHMRVPLVLTGGPAVGKSATARLVALSRPLAAVIDVDEIRQLVISGHAAPWEGQEGRRQHRLGVTIRTGNRLSVLLPTAGARSARVGPAFSPASPAACWTAQLGGIRQAGCVQHSGERPDAGSPR
jgi:hypothetical protein